MLACPFVAGLKSMEMFFGDSAHLHGKEGLSN
jgi:hypothetical protein